MDIKTATEIIKKYKDNKHWREEYVEALEFKNEYLSNILGKILPEASGHYFICGEAGERSSGLPEYIQVCVAYGSDLVAMYKKVGEPSGPEY